jgi:hypothetical protein
MQVVHLFLDMHGQVTIDTIVGGKNDPKIYSLSVTAF